MYRAKADFQGTWGKWPLILAVVLALILAPVLSGLTHFIDEWVGATPENPSSLVQRFLIYEGLLAIVALPLTLLVLRWVPGTTPGAFSRGTFNAAVSPVRLLGLGTKPGTTWGRELLSLGVVITTVTTTFVYFGVRANFSWQQASHAAPWILLFAALNAASEEWLFRVALLRIADFFLPMPKVCLLSALLFGIAHFGGMPGGIGGIVAAAFLGFVLSRATYETGGILAAFLVHFIQDIVIFTGLLGSQL